MKLNRPLVFTESVLGGDIVLQERPSPAGGDEDSMICGNIQSGLVNDRLLVPLDWP